MTARSLCKSFLLSALVVSAVPMDASAFGHRRWRRNRCCRPACCTQAYQPAPTCCDTGHFQSTSACCGATAWAEPQPAYYAPQPAWNSGCCAATGSVMMAPQMAASGGVYQYRSGYQGAVPMTAEPIYSTAGGGYSAGGYSSYGNPTPAGGSMMQQIHANRRALGKP